MSEKKRNLQGEAFDLRDIVKIRRQRGTAVVTIPPMLLKMLNAQVGAELALTVEHGTLMATPVRRKRYRLTELLEGADEMSALNNESAAWIVGPAMGREFL